MQEGQVWEALMFTAHYKLDNLCVIADHNGLQIGGRNEDVMSLGDLPDKLRGDFPDRRTRLPGHGGGL